MTVVAEIVRVLGSGIATFFAGTAMLFGSGSAGANLPPVSQPAASIVATGDSPTIVATTSPQSGAQAAPGLPTSTTIVEQPIIQKIIETLPQGSAVTPAVLATILTQFEQGIEQKIAAAAQPAPPVPQYIAAGGSYSGEGGG